MLLLDENQEVLTLVTNSLKKWVCRWNLTFTPDYVRSDMNHSNMYAVGLALCTFANISSEEMSRDLANEIEKLLGSSNTYIRKKVRTHLVLTFYTLNMLSGRPVCSQDSEESSWPHRPFRWKGQKLAIRSQSRELVGCNHTHRWNVSSGRGVFERIPQCMLSSFSFYHSFFRIHT